MRVRISNAPFYPLRLSAVLLAIVGLAMVGCRSAGDVTTRSSTAIPLVDYRIARLPGWREKIGNYTNLQVVRFFNYSGPIHLEARFQVVLPGRAGPYHEPSMQELQKANVEGMAASAKAARTAKADGATMRVVEQRTARFLGHPAQLIRTAHHNRAGKFPYQVDMVYLVIRKSGVYYFDLSADSAKPEGLDAALDKEWPAFVASISEAGGR